MTQPISPRNYVDSELIASLEVLSNKISALPGAVCIKTSDDKRRLVLDTSNLVCFYEHLATIRDTRNQQFYVVFRKTMDAIFLEQTDPIRYPKWLMDSPVKETERLVYINRVISYYNRNPLLVTNDHKIVDPTGQTRIHLWLEDTISETEFESIAYFLLKRNIIPESMYGKMLEK